MTTEALVRRMLSAALRRTPSPFETRLAVAEYQRATEERKTAKVSADLARQWGADVAGGGK